MKYCQSIGQARQKLSEVGEKTGFPGDGNFPQSELFPIHRALMLFELPEKFQVYWTQYGIQVAADSLEILNLLPEESIDLIVTSPPFALLRQKSYGNKDQIAYVEWLTKFGAAAFRVLKEPGSFVLDIGGAYQRGKPVRSLYNYRVLLKFCDRVIAS